MQTSILIVGQGLAGSVLALEAIDRGIAVKVIDLGYTKGSSYVAAGLVNPITGRQHKLTWQAERLFSTLKPFYRQWERKLKASFFYELPLYFPITSVGEWNSWSEVALSEAYRPFVQPPSDPHYTSLIGQQLKQVTLNQTGYLDTRSFLAAVRAWLVERQLLVEATVDHQAIASQGDRVIYQNEAYDYLVFCEGARATKNPLFDHLDMRPAKGHILEGTIEEGSFQHIINRNGWLLPLSDKKILYGSTYEHTKTDLNVDAEQEQLLLERIGRLLLVDFNHEHTRVGIRPATADRKAFLGRHPVHHRLALFNGLGSKGVSQAPFLARQLLDHLIDQAPLLAEIDIQRKGAQKKR